MPDLTTLCYQGPDEEHHSESENQDVILRLLPRSGVEQITMAQLIFQRLKARAIQNSCSAFLYSCKTCSLIPSELTLCGRKIGGLRLQASEGGTEFKVQLSMTTDNWIGDQKDLSIPVPVQPHGGESPANSAVHHLLNLERLEQWRNEVG